VPQTWTGKSVASGLVVLGCLAALAANPQALQAALLGSGSGALIGSLALGIVVTYRGSGVVNVATGAMAMYGSFVFNSLNTQGKLLVFGWLVPVGGALGFPAATVVTVIVSGVMGGLLYLLVFAPLRGASPIAKLVASVGVLLLLQAIIVLRYGTAPIPVTASFSNGSISFPGHVTVPINQLILCAVLIAAAVLLTLLYRFTRFGLATRAAAEDERRVMLLGHSPLVVSGGNWVFSGMVGGLFAVLAAPINQTVDPMTITLLVVPALAAALFGRFTSFGYAAVGGIVIGMVQALVLYLSTKSWYPTADGSPIPGVIETVPFVVVVAGLLARRARVGGRGALGSVRLPFAPDPKQVAGKLVTCAVVATTGFFVLSSPWRLAEINSLVGVAICLSLVILVGFVGQVSLAQLALAGFAGFTLARLSAAGGIGFPFAPLIGALSATVVGVLFALPALRIRGTQLAVVTLAAGLSIQTLVFQNPVWSGGLQGAQVPPPRLFGLKFGPTDPSSLSGGTIPNPWFGVFCVVVVALLALFTCRLRSSMWGRRMLAVRANERAAAAVGVSVGQTKVAAFAVSAFVAGLAGALSGYRFGSVTPDYFGVFGSLTFLAFAYMGGISSVTGAVVGGLLVTDGLVFTALDHWFGLSPTYAPLVGGLGLVLTVVLNPDGIAGSVPQLKRQLAFVKGLLR
jgi:branched-chain amino acid transport system permease protein